MSPLGDTFPLPAPNPPTLSATQMAQHFNAPESTKIPGTLQRARHCSPGLVPSPSPHGAAVAPSEGAGKGAAPPMAVRTPWGPPPRPAHLGVELGQRHGGRAAAAAAAGREVLQAVPQRAGVRGPPPRRGEAGPARIRGLSRPGTALPRGGGGRRFPALLASGTRSGRWEPGGLCGRLARCLLILRGI